MNIFSCKGSQNFRKVHKKTTVLMSRFNKLLASGETTLFKKRLLRRCFLLNIAKLLKTPFLQNVSERLPQTHLTS